MPVSDQRRRAILEIPVSDRGTLERLTQFGVLGSGGGCKLLILNGEMSEWLKEHAWKAIRENITKRYRNSLLRNRFNNLPPRDAL